MCAWIVSAVNTPQPKGVRPVWTAPLDLSNLLLVKLVVINARQDFFPQRPELFFALSVHLGSLTLCRSSRLVNHAHLGSTKQKRGNKPATIVFMADSRLRSRNSSVWIAFLVASMTHWPKLVALRVLWASTTR
jgi:hypothetical protein